ncbi:hypothetical protein BKA81DRAFT_25794 [Phyllosticta paracitricarpa]
MCSQKFNHTLLLHQPRPSSPFFRSTTYCCLPKLVQSPDNPVNPAKSYSTIRTSARPAMRRLPLKNNLGGYTILYCPDQTTSPPPQQHTHIHPVVVLMRKRFCLLSELDLRCEMVLGDDAMLYGVVARSSIGTERMRNNRWRCWSGDSKGSGLVPRGFFEVVPGWFPRRL